MAERATRRQQELLQFIDDFIREHGYGPSYREIMTGLGYKSVSTVAVHVDGLLTRGYIRKKDRSARSIEVVTRHESLAQSVAPASQPELRWLEQQIEAQIADKAPLADIQTLVAAARILGSSATVTLEKKVEAYETAHSA